MSYTSRINKGLSRMRAVKSDKQFLTSAMAESFFHTGNVTVFNATAFHSPNSQTSTEENQEPANSRFLLVWDDKIVFFFLKRSK